MGWLRTGSLRYCETITFKNRKQRETYSNIHYHQSEWWFAHPENPQKYGGHWLVGWGAKHISNQSPVSDPQKQESSKLIITSRAYIFWEYCYKNTHIYIYICKYINYILVPWRQRRSWAVTTSCKYSSYLYKYYSSGYFKSFQTVDQFRSSGRFEFWIDFRVFQVGYLPTHGKHWVTSWSGGKPGNCWLATSWALADLTRALLRPSDTYAFYHLIAAATRTSTLT